MKLELMLRTHGWWKFWDELVQFMRHTLNVKCQLRCDISCANQYSKAVNPNIYVNMRKTDNASRIFTFHFLWISFSPLPVGISLVYTLFKFEYTQRNDKERQFSLWTCTGTCASIHIIWQHYFVWTEFEFYSICVVILHYINVFQNGN